MNIKVVIIWAFSIVVFAVIGLFGYFNQDLLVEKDNGDTIYVPQGDETTGITKVCSGKSNYGASSYKFTLDDANNVTKVTATYSATAADIDTYASASNINNATIAGVKTVLSGTSSDFVLIVETDLATFSSITANDYTNDFLKLSMVIDSITSYDDYVKAINNANNNAYSCS